MKAAISVKSPFSHSALFGLTTFGFAMVIFMKAPFCRTLRQETWSPLQSYNCAVRLLEHPCPSVAIHCSDGLRTLIVLLGGHGTLQRDQGTEWTHSRKF